MYEKEQREKGQVEDQMIPHIDTFLARLQSFSFSFKLLFLISLSPYFICPIIIAPL